MHWLQVHPLALGMNWQSYFAQEGYNLIAVSRTEEDLNRVAEEF